MKTAPPKKKKAAKPRRAADDAKFADEVERAQWPEIKRKVDAAFASLKKGKGRKWNLDRFLTDAEKRLPAK